MKKLNFYFAFVSLLCLFCTKICAQIKCGNQALIESIKLDKNLFEEYLKATEEFENIFKNSQLYPESDSLRIVPIVVHVMHPPNDATIGSRSNISEAQIKSQIDVLNEDFGKIPGSRGFNNDQRGANTRFQFCLASIDPNGNPTNGINRLPYNNSATHQMSDDLQMKQGIIWPTSKYLNIWVVANIFDGTNQVLGYAYMPTMVTNTSFREQVDGIVLAAKFFGSIEKRKPNDPPFFLNPPFNLGRTASHEIGHFFNLIHTWGDGNCNKDDEVDDTPNCEDPFYGCSATPVLSCGNIRMIQNYMDYSNDACFNIFTNGQKNRMHTAAANFSFRNNLSTIENLTITGCLAQEIDSLAIVKGKIQTVLINNTLPEIPEIRIFDKFQNGVIATNFSAVLINKPQESAQVFNQNFTTSVSGWATIPFQPDGFEGTYQIEVKHNLPIKGNPDTITIHVIKDLSLGNKYTLYPNPTRNDLAPGIVYLNAQMQQVSDLQIVFMDISGKQTYLINLPNVETTSADGIPVEIGHLNKGIYIVKINSSIDSKVFKLINL